MTQNEILTLGGVWMDPFDARPEQIFITDIAHALSMLVRANGHIRSFYTVAQHSLNCEREAAARGLDARMRLFALLHDAPECYIADLTRPVKRRLPLYCEADAKLLETIYTALCSGVPTPEEWRIICEIDDAMMWHEFYALRGVTFSPEAPKLFCECLFGAEDIAKVRRRFEESYARLAGRG
jgi:hypothetical protein